MLLKGDRWTQHPRAGIADYDGAVERAVKFAQDMLVSAFAPI